MYRTKGFAPIFNTKDFICKLECNGALDASFHNRILETILFPGTELVVKKKSKEVYIVQTNAYPTDKDLYIHSKFVEKGEAFFKPALPSLKEILLRLVSFPRLPYLLGGTIPVPIHFQIQTDPLSFTDRNKKLFGIDCSGLLHYVTNGYTPRNTSDLLQFGKQVKVLQPLDLILFSGHVIIYLGDGMVIESRETNGVTISSWEERQKSILKDYKFIRWHPQASL